MSREWRASSLAETSYGSDFRAPDAGRGAQVGRGQPEARASRTLDGPCTIRWRHTVGDLLPRCAAAAGESRGPETFRFQLERFSRRLPRNLAAVVVGSR